MSRMNGKKTHTHTSICIIYVFELSRVRSPSQVLWLWGMGGTERKSERRGNQSHGKVKRERRRKDNTTLNYTTPHYSIFCQCVFIIVGWKLPHHHPALSCVNRSINILILMGYCYCTRVLSPSVFCLPDGRPMAVLAKCMHMCVVDVYQFLSLYILSHPSSCVSLRLAFYWGWRFGGGGGGRCGGSRRWRNTSTGR